MSVSDFVVSAADAAAIRLIEATGSWVLRERDIEIFMNALLDPPEPNTRTIAPFRSHKSRVESS